MKYLLLTLLILSGWPIFAQPLEYRAEYVAEYRGLPVRAKGIRELVRLEDNRYRMSSLATSFLAKISETSEFVLEGDTLQPQGYQYRRTGLGKNKSESSQFDWASGLLIAGDLTSELAPGTHDKLSYQYQLRLDVAEAITTGVNDPILEYLVADEEKRKLYRFEIVGEETIETPVGAMNTVRVERLREDSNRETIFWLAVDHDFVLVKFIQLEGDKGFELNLSSATVGGVAL
ncbi:MAG: DUF3108 domain-containing protein [Proteobacteria bacterium]|nr:DUF3108 domain-containing protein [Pseudomonadota bacterium]